MHAERIAGLIVMGWLGAAGSACAGSGGGIGQAPVGGTAAASGALGAAAAPLPPGPASAASGPASAPAPRPVTLRWTRVPRAIGRLDAQSLGLVINLADPYSVEVGEYYAARRRIPAQHILRVKLPRQSQLSAAELAELRQAVDRHFGAQVQGLALAWTQPYAVECQSITGALTLGFAPDLCRQTCSKPAASRYFNSPSGAPHRDLGLRPSMLLAAGSVEQARALIDRGVAADGSLGLRGSLPVHAYYMVTRDAARSVRLPLFPPPTGLRAQSVVTHVATGDLPAQDDPLLLVQTGAATLSGLERLRWVPGAMADHLTSYGGQLGGGSGQTSALAWIEAGATASYGTVSEPCNHVQKFPHPQLALLHYLQGATLIEAYWKSVKWPQQGLFIGEPLAAPFAPVTQ